MCSLAPGNSASTPRYFAVFQNKLFFQATASLTYGTELYTYDPTTATAALVADINPGPDSSSPSSLTVAGSALYFAATTAAYGTEVFRYDGNAVELVTDIVAGSGSSFPDDFVLLDGKLYFRAYIVFPTTGRELVALNLATHEFAVTVSP